MSTSHIDYNHLYYFWHVYKEGSVIGAVETLYLTPQTITGQVRVLGECLQEKLFKRKGRGPEPNELGELIYRYADRIFTLSQEILGIVNYRKESNSLSDVGVTDVLSRCLANSVLDATVVEDKQIHLRCSKPTYEALLEQLNRYKLDMIISDYSIDPTQQEGLFSMKISKCGASFWHTSPLPERSFSTCLEERRLLIPGRRSMSRCKLLNWLNSQGSNIKILGESDDAALMKASRATHNAIFVAPPLYTNDFYNDDSAMEIGRVENVMEKYRAIFIERMAQYPTVQRVCNADYSALFIPTSK